MIKTTRIKYSQAPRIIVDDLSPQCDGVKQTFTLSRPVPEWAPYCLVFNGQLYTNTSYKKWFVLDADRKTIHTSFITPPTQGPNKSLILIVGVAGMEDLGVSWDAITNKPEIPTEEEVDAKDAAVLEDAKSYADTKDTATLNSAKSYADTEAANTLQDAKDYADTQDQAILAEAKAYTDEYSGEGGVLQTYVDQQDAATLSSAKTYADTEDTATLNSAKTYTDAEVADVLQNAKGYADNVGAETLASANEAISTAITQANIPVITLSNIDIEEGSELAANNFYGVYE